MPHKSLVIMVSIALCLIAGIAGAMISADLCLIVPFWPEKVQFAVPRGIICGLIGAVVLALLLRSQNRFSWFILVITCALTFLLGFFLVCFETVSNDL